MRWTTGEYDRLWKQVTDGQQTQCYVQGRNGRDICHIRPDFLEFNARGIGYGGVEYMDKEIQYEEFLKECVRLKVEWLDYSDESPSSDPAEVLVKALEDIRDYYTPGLYCHKAADTALSQYEQLKQQ